jgi:hypothetical protein
MWWPFCPVHKYSHITAFHVSTYESDFISLYRRFIETKKKKMLSYTEILHYLLKSLNLQHGQDRHQKLPCRFCLLCLTFRVWPFKCRISAAGRSSIRFKCLLQDGVFPFGQKGCTFIGKTLSRVSIKAFTVSYFSDLSTLTK